MRSPLVRRMLLPSTALEEGRRRSFIRSRAQADFLSHCMPIAHAFVMSRDFAVVIKFK